MFQITEESLRAKFSEKGLVTDVQLKHKNGVFRRFGFVGFKKEEDAKSALDYFNNTCIGSSRIQVEVCADLGRSLAKLVDGLGLPLPTAQAVFLICLRFVGKT